MGVLEVYINLERDLKGRFLHHVHIGQRCQFGRIVGGRNVNGNGY